MSFGGIALRSIYSYTKKIKMLIASRPFIVFIFGFICGFIVTVVGAILILTNLRIIGLGDLGEWIGALATVLAVVVSLYLARSANKPKLSIERLPCRSEPSHRKYDFEIVNCGTGSANIRISLTIDDDFLNLYLLQFPESVSREVWKLRLFQVLNSSIINNSGAEMSYDRHFISPKESIIVTVDVKKNVDWLKSKVESGKGNLEIVVQDVDGIVKKEQICDFSLENKDSYVKVH
ncbi:hypothetical protein ACA604_01175 [Lactiplantibacillus pentosus]|uniref:hypothetical protein n=1 Tax=Lactiplantibacillus pentosus TaxID=1589 RepID=UPI003C264736